MKNDKIKSIIVFIIVFVVLAYGRFIISGKGYLEDSDEYAFVYMIEVWEKLCNGDSETWSSTIFRVWSHLPDNFIRFLQMIPMMTYAKNNGMSPYHPETLIIVGYFNIISSILLLFIFFQLLRKLKFDFAYSIVGVLLFGTLVSSNIYTRHFLQYDHSLIWHLLSILILIDGKISTKKILLVGFISAIGVTSYPPHFLFVAITGGLLYFNYYNGFIPSIKRLIYFLIPFILVVGLIEIFCRIDGRSYINFLLEYGGEARNIDVREKFSLIIKYFYYVEGYWGLLLLLISLIGIVKVVILDIDKSLNIILLLGLGAYSTFCILSILTSSMVMYGRGVYMYCPFVVLGLLYFLKSFNRKILYVFAIGALVNYVFVLKILNEINYPKQWMYQYGITNTSNIQFDFKYELVPGLKYEDTTSTRVLDIEKSTLDPGRYDVVNVCFFYHEPETFIQKYQKYSVDEKDEVINQTPYFMSYPIYAFQYCAKIGRNFFIDNDINMMLVKKNNTNIKTL